MADQAQSLNWSALAGLFVHPLKVSILEAFACIRQPLSATDLATSFDDKEGHPFGNVTYHLKSLAGAGVVKRQSSRQVRGAEETFYSLAPGMLEDLC